MLYDIIILKPSVIYDWDCDHVMWHVTSCFFLNQQFITWNLVADHGNYLVVIYI